MYISSIEINNYKSYLSPGGLEFKPGFNVITSQNNTGKTALLEAMQLGFDNIPHRSLSNMDKFEQFAKPHSTVRVTITVPRKEMLACLNRHVPIYVPVYSSSFVETLTDSRDEKIKIDAFNDWLLQQDNYKIDVLMPATKSFGVQNLNDYGQIKKDWYDIYEINPGRGYSVVLCVDNERKAYNVSNSPDITKRISEPGGELFSQLTKSIFGFRAERYNHGECEVGSSAVLANDRANLAEVLNHLQSNTQRHAQYIEKVRQILPNIHDVTVRTVRKTHFQIITWNDKFGRDDLTVPLNDCGTGVGQVLAMLYVVITARTPQTILIDEPNSFLHPGAVRKLIEVLQEYPQHQYILTTHSSTVITASKPSTLTMIKKREAESYFEAIDPNENDQARVYLNELGALADVFGADNILWVEGETEQECFPYIVKKLLQRPLLGTVISKVLHTGDFDKNPMLAFQVYTQISKLTSLIPPTIGFIFDREDRTPAHIKEWERESHDLVSFLPRRLYENYLVDSEAISAVINECDTERSSDLTPEDVQAWIDQEVDDWMNEAAQLQQRGKGSASTPLINEKQKRYSKAPSVRDKWKDSIHAAHLLEALFEHFCEARLPYQKTDHSKRLTLWLIEHKPQELEDITQLLRRAFGRSTTV